MTEFNDILIWGAKNTATIMEGVKDMNIKMIKIDPAKVLSATVTILGIAGTLLSAKVQANERAELKEELMKEVLAELKK